MTGTATLSAEVKPFDNGAGAEIAGIDLSQPLREEDFNVWRDAFLQYGTIVFHGQDFTEAEHVAASEWFGPLEVFPDPKDQAVGFDTILRVTNVEKDTGGIRSYANDVGFKSFILGTGDWHIDSSYRANPGKASLLYAIEIPSEGGDTKFANTRLAYEAMPEKRKKELVDVYVFHDFNAIRRRKGLPLRPAHVAKITPPVRHKLVTPLPDGTHVLMIGNHAEGIEGLPQDESEAMLEELKQWCIKPEFVYHHKWKVGDMVMWDNKSIMHRAMPYDMENERRLLHRTTIAGESTVI